MANTSLNQVLMRSLNTSFVALLPVASLLVVGVWIYGALALRDFGLALFVGLLTGAYSSIFVATPILAWLKEREPKHRAVAARVETRAQRAAAPEYQGEPEPAPVPAAAGSRTAAVSTPSRSAPAPAAAVGARRSPPAASAARVGSASSESNGGSRATMGVDDEHHRAPPHRDPGRRPTIRAARGGATTSTWRSRR